MCHPDTAHIIAAQREGTRQRLISAGIRAERVHELLASFDAPAGASGRAWDGEAAYRDSL